MSFFVFFAHFIMLIRLQPHLFGLMVMYNTLGLFFFKIPHFRYITPVTSIFLLVLSDKVFCSGTERKMASRLRLVIKVII